MTGWHLPAALRVGHITTGKPRCIFRPLLRDSVATAYHDIDVTNRAAQWQAVRATGARSRTWDISDRVRNLGLHGMLYASRSDPAKTHLTLFDWNTPTGAQVTADGPPIAWGNVTG